MPVEIILGKLVADIGPTLIIQHQPAKNRLLRLDRVWRYPQGIRILFSAGQGKLVEQKNTILFQKRPQLRPSKPHPQAQDEGGRHRYALLRYGKGLLKDGWRSSRPRYLAPTWQQ